MVSWPGQHAAEASGAGKQGRISSSLLAMVVQVAVVFVAEERGPGEEERGGRRGVCACSLFSLSSFPFSWYLVLPGF